LADAVAAMQTMKTAFDSVRKKLQVIRTR